MEAILEKNEKEIAIGGKYLVFNLEEKSYGISISLVNEIIGLVEITPVPKTPKAFKGIINLRGKFIPVIDLRIRLGMEERVYDGRTCIIIINTDEGLNKQIGFIVDMVSEVFDINSSQIVPPFEFKKEKEEEFLQGIGKVKEKVVILLDVFSLMEF
jgi:purine-binding chemotaxis protein CheW